MNDAPQPPEKLTLSPALIQARERLSLTQAQLASQSGLSIAAIKGYETGRTLPGARELRQLCLTLRITPNKLIFGEEAPFPAGDGNGANALDSKYVPLVQRSRIAVLLPYLTAEESAAIYALASGIVLARRGGAALEASVEGADLIAGLQVVADGGPFVSDLFRSVLRDRKVTLELLGALQAAAAEAAESKQSYGVE